MCHDWAFRTDELCFKLHVITLGQQRGSALDCTPGAVDGAFRAFRGVSNCASILGHTEVSQLCDRFSEHQIDLTAKEAPGCSDTGRYRGVQPGQLHALSPDLHLRHKDTLCFKENKWTDLKSNEFQHIEVCREL